MGLKGGSVLLEKNVKDLFELVKSALSKTTYPHHISKETYIYARENGLSGMFYPVLDKNVIEPKVYARLQSDYYEYLKRDTLQLGAIEEVHQLFQKENIRHVFLKGSFLKKIYPETYMRSMGDIDILVKNTDMSKVHEVLPKLGYLNWSNSSAHDCFKKGENLFLEIHPSLDSEIDERYSPLFLNTWENVLMEDGFDQFNPVFLLSYLLFHMIKHLSNSGIGIRNILDIGLFVMKYENKLEAPDTLKFLENNHLLKFFQNVIFLSIRYFGFKIDQAYLESYEIDEPFFEELTNFIIISGVHGSGKEHNPYLSGISNSALQEQSLKSGKKKYLLKTFFPPLKTMKGIYHYLDKYPALLPFSWLQRAFRLIFKKTKNTVQKIKMLNIEEEAIQRTEEMYRKLGL